MSENFIAQYGEDRWLAEHWTVLGLPDRGIFVEVGACDGRHLSNTYWLEKDRGWTGLLIEPDPRWLDDIERNRPACRTYRGAAGGYTGWADFGLMDDPSLNGVARVGQAPRTLTVPMDLLSNICRKHEIVRVDVLSIDTEGSERDVWAGFIRSPTVPLPRIVIVEWLTTGLTDERASLIELWNLSGYRLAATTESNLIFVLKLEDAFMPKNRIQESAPIK